MLMFPRLKLAKSRIVINDLEKATLDFNDFLRNTRQLTLEDHDNDSGEGVKSTIVTSILTHPMWASIDFGEGSQISDLHDNLVRAWITPLSPTFPGRTRIALEKSLRNAAAQMCLESYGIRPNSTTQDDNDKQEEAFEPGAEFTLPVRRRASFLKVKKSKEPEARSSSPTATLQDPRDDEYRALPTPEPTPSLHSQASVSSMVDDPASQRLQAYANPAQQPDLPVKLSKTLDQWRVGADPMSYHWEATEQAFASDDEEEISNRAKERERAEKRQKRRREPTLGASSQPQPFRLGDSQPPVVTQGSSSQMTDAVMHSQPQAGRLGGSLGKATKKAKPPKLPKRPGFN